MEILLFVCQILIIILLISVLSTCSDINDNIMDIERTLRSYPKRVYKYFNHKKEKK